MRKTGTIILLAAFSMNTICKKECPETSGYVSGQEREWIAYAPGETASFINADGGTGTLMAGAVESMWHNPGGSKGECPNAFESLHQPLSGIGLPNGTEITVAHNRETGNGPAQVCSPLMDMAPVNEVAVNGVTYDNVYITHDSVYCFTKADGLIKAGEWMRVP